MTKTPVLRHAIEMVACGTKRDLARLKKRLKKVYPGIYFNEPWDDGDWWVMGIFIREVR